MKLNELGEFGLIEKIGTKIGQRGGKIIKGIGDDCAVVESSDEKVLLFTTDILVEGIHFKRAYTDPADLGRKAMAVNISDIAAMGGKPLYALLCLGAPKSAEVIYIDSIISGISSMAGEYGVELVGGDTSLSPDVLYINIYLAGESSKDEVLYRSGAGAEQVIFVTGEVGSSGAGLDILNRAVNLRKFAALTDAHNSPHPHVKEGRILSSSRLVTSLIDISDGVIADLGHICKESNVGALIKEKDLPILDLCRQYCGNYGLDATDFALYGGEDYVLLGTVPEHSYYQLRDQMKSGGCSIFPIGKTKAEPGIRLQDQDGGITDAGDGGYDHFKSHLE